VALVVDSSLVIASLAREQQRAFADQVLEESEPLVGPALLPFEVVNVLEIKVRRSLLDIDGRDLALKQFHALRIRLFDPPDRERLGRIAALASRFRLSGYDASYLELALDLRADLATLDGDLADAALASGLKALIESSRPKR